MSNREQGDNRRDDFLFIREFKDINVDESRDLVANDRVASISQDNICNIDSRILNIHTSVPNTLHLDECSSNYMLAGFSNGYVELFDMNRKQRDKGDGPISLTFGKGHRFSLTSVQWYPHDTGIFVTGSTDKKILVWDTNEFTPVAKFWLGEKVLSVGVPSRVKGHFTIAAATDVGTVHLCDVDSGSSVQKLTGHSGPVNFVKWLRNTPYLLASGGVDGSVVVWDIRFNRNAYRKLDSGLGVSHSGAVRGLDISNDGNHIVSIDNDNRIHLWNSATGDNVDSIFIPQSRSSPNGIFYSINDAYLYVIGKELSVIDVENSSILSRSRIHLAEMTDLSVGYSVADPFLVSCGADRSIIMWNSASGESDNRRRTTEGDSWNDT